MAINCFIFIHIRYLYKLSDVYSSHDYRLVFDVSSLMPQDTCKFLIVVIPNPISFLWHFLHYAKYKHFSYKKCYLYDSWISFLQQNKQIMLFFLKTNYLKSHTYVYISCNPGQLILKGPFLCYRDLRVQPTLEGFSLFYLQQKTNLLKVALS